jgi:hypothetical protein
VGDQHPYGCAATVQLTEIQIILVIPRGAARLPSLEGERYQWAGKAGFTVSLA